MARILTLTNEQFDVLHNHLEDTINDINDNVDHENISLSDYVLYHIWQQMNSNKSEPKVTITDDNYGDKVDTLVSNMAASNDKEFTHDSEGC